MSRRFLLTIISFPDKDGKQVFYEFTRAGAGVHITDMSQRCVSGWYHSFELLTLTLSDNSDLKILIGKRGALRYILKPPTEDDPLFMEISDGYHSFAVKGRQLYGKTGGWVEEAVSIDELRPTKKRT